MHSVGLFDIIPDPDSNRFELLSGPDGRAAPVAQRTLDAKVQEVFGDLSIDKRRLPASHLQRRGIPAYVGEWVLDAVARGTGPLTAEEADRVQRWASRFIPEPGQANEIRSRLIDGEAIKLLTSVDVDVILTRKRQERVARMSLLGLNDAMLPEGMVQRFPDLLKQGMWGIAEIASTGDGVVLMDFRPMQAKVDLDLYKEKRAQFTLDEWQGLLLTSMGYNPAAFTQEERIWLLCRLLPLVQKNMHVIELAPKGTGKSYVYENISPRVRLVSGGNVSPAVLFVNNQSGQWGLLGRYSVVVLDEVQTLKFEKPQEIVGGLKGYLANGQLTRGGLHQAASDCGLVLLANIALDSEQRPLRDPIVQELPEFLQETAFLDRIRALIPGWRIRKLSGECMARGVGLKSDFFGDALYALRNDLKPDQRIDRKLALTGGSVYKRNEDAVRANACGLMKILFPHGEVSDADLDTWCVQPAVQLRQNIWSQMQAMDGEYRKFDSDIHYEIRP